VIFEGAQATLLDLDHGTYPFVTSSNPVAGAACIGAGIGPHDIDEVWGVVKAYQTRVGAGPFPTELEDEIGRLMVERGHEFGTTTGRERRCGWLDLVGLRYAVRLNRMDALTITKLDVLTGIDPLRVAVRYRSSEGAVFEEFPYHQSILHSASAEYEELPGWDEEIGDARDEADLPPQARDYLRYISDFVGVPIRLVSVGPDREQVVWIGERPALRAA
jgi:adenylosuccinate synthase